jgi:hypothetical protein
MRYPILPATITLALLSCGEPAKMRASAYPIGSLQDAIGGPKAVAQPGDFILENGHARVAILSARSSLGPGLHGGSLVDADLVRTDPGSTLGRGRDQFAEMFPTVNMNVVHPAADRVWIAEDAPPGQAIVRAEGPAEPFLSLLEFLWIVVSAPDWWMWTDYVAEDGVPWFRLSTTVAVRGATDPTSQPDADVVASHDEPFPLIDWAIGSGLVLGDFYLQGGSVDVFAPGIGFDEDGAVFRSQEAGENTFLDPFQFEFLAGVADGVSYGLAPVNGELFVPLFTASQTVAVGGATNGDGTNERFAADQAFVYDRYFFVGYGDVGSVVDQYLEARKIPYGTISGHVFERSTDAPVSGISVFVYKPGDDFPWSQFATDIHPEDRVADGSFAARLPVGDWELLVHQRGRPDGKRVPITVRKGEDTSLALEAGRFGTLSFSVRDDQGRALPSKVTFFREDAAPTRDPVLGDGFVGGAPESVVFAMYGEGEVELAPGRYRAIASRGLEYEVDLSGVFEVGEAQGARQEFVLQRSVDTRGWISADLHVHAVRSHDSGVILADRVRTMVAEGVEFFASTDHDYLVDYAPTVEALGLEQWVQTAIGNETTTVEVGHFLAFPLAQDFLLEAGGGRDAVDWTDKKPLEMIESLRGMGKAVDTEPFVFVGHPRDGILGYFDQFGFDPFNGTPGVGGEPGQAIVVPPLFSGANDLLAPGNVSWEFDGLELLNGKRFDFLRTPTIEEVTGYAEGTSGSYDWTTRTLAEQQALIDGAQGLSPDVQGQIDDWFTLLNLGFTFTALGNSDTHGWSSTESGCPRNYVLVDEDDPAFLDDQAVADAVRAHRVVASYGPFVEFRIDAEPVGGTVTGEGEHELVIDVQAPTWVAVDRVELYENGTLIREWEVEGGTGVVRFHEEFAVTPATDAWYVVIVQGDGDLAPVFTPVEIPYIELETIVTEALGGVEKIPTTLLSEATPLPRTYPVRPFALTNPIWIDRAGDGFDAAGVPDWFQPGDPPEE